jgi:hypothetical protein
MADSTSLNRLRVLLGWAGGALAAQALALLWLQGLLGQAPFASSVLLGLVTFEQHVLLLVYIRAAAVVLLVLVAASFLLLASRGVFEKYGRKLARNRHGARWIIFSLTSSITVFLVAQLNGVTEIGSLVLIYAATSTMTLFSVLQEAIPSSTFTRMLPLCFGAAIGIVPWGIIAFYEIAGTIAGDGPDLPVRILTIVMLIFAVAFVATNWAEQRRAARGIIDARGEHAFIVLSAIAASVFAWAVMSMSFS